MPIIWAGDHNITQNARIDRHPMRFDNDYGNKEFLGLINVFDLKDVCRSIFPTQDCFTFRRGISKSRIDAICVSEGFTTRYYKHNDSGFSDHMMVEAEIVYEATFDRGPGIWKNNVKYYKEQDFLGGFTHFWNKRVSDGYGEYRDNVVDWWLKFKYDFKMYYIKLSRDKINNKTG